MTDGAMNATGKNDSTPVQETVTLQLENGASMEFAGRQFAGGSWYDEETGVLTRQSLYVTSENEHVYSMVSGQGNKRSRRAYRVALEGERCTINDGRQEVTMELEMLMMAVRALAGLDKESAPALEVVEDTLRAANC